MLKMKPYLWTANNNVNSDHLMSWSVETSYAEKKTQDCDLWCFFWYRRGWDLSWTKLEYKIHVVNEYKWNLNQGHN